MDFVLSFLMIMVIPRRRGNINVNLIPLVCTMFTSSKRLTFVLMLLVEYAGLCLFSLGEIISLVNVIIATSLVYGIFLSKRDDQ